MSLRKNEISPSLSDSEKNSSDSSSRQSLSESASSSTPRKLKKPKKKTKHNYPSPSKKSSKRHKKNVSRSNSTPRKRSSSRRKSKKPKKKSESREKKSYNLYNLKRRSRSRSNDRDKREKDSKKKEKTQEEIKKEKERKMQIRLAKARALKFEKEESNNLNEKDENQANSQENNEKIENNEEDKNNMNYENNNNNNDGNVENGTDNQKRKKYADESDWLEDDDEEENQADSKPKESNPINKYNNTAISIVDGNEVDLLDAYMKSIEKNSAKQEAFQLFHHKDQTFFHPMNKPSGNEKEIVEEVIHPSQLITYEEIMMKKNENPPQIEEEFKEVDTLDQDDDFHQAFISAIKQKPAPINESNISEEKHELMNEEVPPSRPQREFLSEDEDIIEYVKTDMDEVGDDYFTKQRKLAEKKDLKPTDHSKVLYETFRKNFYIESKEITCLKPEEKIQLRKDLGDIKVRGKNCPTPISNWYQCGLSDKILKILIDKRKYAKPFPIQCQAMPAIMTGLDVIGIAETGSGKTLAYLLPMYRHILDQKPIQESDGPIALIMAPTRELSTQIYNECKLFTKHLNLNVVCVYGGAGVAGQLSDLKRGTEIVVCTPGRMIDVLCTSNGKITNLKRVTYVVLDEADRMFDMGFEPQIAKIMGNIRPERQTVMFSATFPKNVENLAKKILRDPIEIVVGSRGQVCSNVEQIIEVRDASTKFLRLLEILGEWNDKGSILIFVDRQLEADELFKELLKAGYLALVLHGGQDQIDREYTILDFKKGVRNIMVATSVCARGLDIKSLVLVINFSCPNHLEDYIHRIGRTGRAGNKGTAITFVSPEDEAYTADIIKAFEIATIKVPVELRELAENFKTKVDKGEAKIYSNKNLKGSGFKFDETEREKMRDVRNAFKKQFDIELHLSEGELSDEEILKKKNHNEKEDELGAGVTVREKLKEKRNDHDLLNLIKDPNTKAAALSAASKAALEKINQGGTSDEVLLAAKESIKKVLDQYKPTANSSEEGLEKAIRVRDDILAREEENSDVISAELEINDYPLQARQKVIQKDYLGMIHDLTNCTISLRGTYFEPNKKVPLGQRKLYLNIESENKYNVTSAYREIKRVLEETALQTLNVGHVGKYSF